MAKVKSKYKIAGRVSTIFRTEKNKDNPYVMMDTRPLLNVKLSFKAKGILAYFMSRPDGWEISIADLIHRSTDGRDGIYAGMKELKDAGHIEYFDVREKGKFKGWMIKVYEVPFLASEPLTAKPYTAKPLTANPPQVVLSTLSNKKKKNLKPNQSVVVVLKQTRKKKLNPATTTFSGGVKENPFFSENLEMCKRMAITEPMASSVANAMPFTGTIVDPEFIRKHVENLSDRETIGLAIIRIKAGEEPREFRPGAIIVDGKQMPKDYLPVAPRYSMSQWQGTVDD